MRLVVVVLVVLAILPFVSATECSESDAGLDYYTFGYLTYGGLIKLDTCSSSKQLTEYYCSGSSYKSVVVNCDFGCSGGLCVSSTSCTPGACNTILHAWCDGSGSWRESGYCDNCAGSDPWCGQDFCVDGACDPSTKQYCLNGQWTSAYYCDIVNCGTDQYSQDICFCSKESVTETNCKDGKDNDCDGSIDCNDSDCSSTSGCQCTEGDTQACGSDIGECTAGVQTCTGGSWSECSATQPSTETCDSLDNDCNGQVDEDCVCSPGDVRDCGEEIGVCKAGVQMCNADGSWSLCFGASYAAAQVENCNGLDDDCDGKVDEGCSCSLGGNQTCGSDVGVCHKGTQWCVNGTWSSCDGGIASSPEVCGDLLDNDCDGAVDYEDDTCAKPNATGGSVTPSSQKKEIECADDTDCGSGYFCSRNQCIVQSRNENVFVSSAETTNEGTVVGSSTKSDVETTPDETSNLILIVPLVVLAILFFGGGFWYLKKRKTGSVDSNRLFRANVSGKAGSSLKMEAPASSSDYLQIKERKTSIEKKLDKSLEESKRVFGK